MSAMEIGPARFRPMADEIAWRRVWLSNVMVDSGKRGPTKIARHRPRRMSWSRRLQKLHRMRAALGASR